MAENNNLEELHKRAAANQSAEAKSAAGQEKRIERWRLRDAKRSEKYAGRSVSKIVNAVRMNLLIKGLLITAWLMTAMLSVPYFDYLRHPVRVAGRTWRGNSYVFDPSVDGFGLMYLGIFVTALVLVLLIIWFVGISGAKGQLEKEKKWLTSLPFKIEGYLEALGNTELDRYYIKIRYNEYPEKEFMGNLIRSLSHSTITYDRGFNSPDELKIDFDSFWTPRSKNGYRLHLLMHRLVEEILLPIHKDFPVKKVTVNEDDLAGS